MIRVVLPFHLRTLARVEGEVQIEAADRASIASVLDAIETAYPALRGTIRDHVTLRRRPFVRFFACKEDLSNVPPETLLPEAVVSGQEPFLIVGAMAGGWAQSFEEIKKQEWTRIGRILRSATHRMGGRGWQFIVRGTKALAAA